MGYARVSTRDQNLTMQLDALHNAGVDKIFQETVSATKKDRPEFTAMKAILRSGDIVVVTKLDRLGRSLKDLIEHLDLFNEIGVQLVSLSENLDTSTATGKMLFNFIAMFAQMERDIISERTVAGLASARARGRLGGRKKGITKASEHKAILAVELYKENKTSVNDIAKQLKMSKMSLYKYLRLKGIQVGATPRPYVLA